VKFAIISRERGCYSTRRLRQAVLDRGHTVRVLDTYALSVSLETSRPRLFYAGKPLGTFHAVIPRIGASATFYGTAAVRQFEQMGTYVVTSSRAITMSRDKLHALQVLSRHGIGIAPTAFVRQPEEILPAISRVGGAPVIIKLLEGTQGNGVILAETARTAESMISALQGAKQNVLIQRFVSESKGRDIRAVVVGGRVVAAMRRRAAGDDFRSNLHRGGQAEPVQLTSAYETTALRAAQVLGLAVAGVDMLETHEGPQVLEVNSSPGLEGIELATGVDVAGAIIEHAEAHVRFPEVDLRQRLKLGSGHEIAEIRVGRRSTLAKVTLRESGLRDAGIQVLSITRGGEVLMNPRGDQRVLAGDVLLCLGRHSDLAEVVMRRRLATDSVPLAPTSPAPESTRSAASPRENSRRLGGHGPIEDPGSAAEGETPAPPSSTPAEAASMDPAPPDSSVPDSSPPGSNPSGRLRASARPPRSAAPLPRDAQGANEAALLRGRT
jgi:ribosomal protein S6--L-glutamate ligase